MPRILLVEDDDVDAMWFERAFEDSPREVELKRVNSLGAAKDQMLEDPFDCVVLDLNLPDAGGVTTLVHMTADAFTCPVLVMSGQTDPSLPEKALKAGFAGYIVKGEIAVDELQRLVLNLLN